MVVSWQRGSSMSEVGYSGDRRSEVQQTAKTHIMKQAKVVDKHVRARRADGRDAEVGRRVRSRRLECRLSQTELADRIGVTFQQVQKYEKGVNRIGAGRLQRISEALEVPISFFFRSRKAKQLLVEMAEELADAQAA